MSSIDRAAYAQKKQAEEQAALAPLRPYMTDLTNLNPDRAWAGEADRIRKILTVTLTFGSTRVEGIQNLAVALEDPQSDPELVRLVKAFLGESDAQVWASVNPNILAAKLMG